MRRILLGLLTIALGTTLVFKLTQAFFSDVETSVGNTLQAGAVDLLVSNASYYNGIPNPGTSWGPTNLDGNLLFDFNDLKPGDFGEDTIGLTVQNDAYICMSVIKTEDDDKTCNNPEITDDPTCDDPDTDLMDGELGSLTHFRFWADDGDSVYEDDETIFKSGTASALFDGSTWTIADSISSIWPILGPVPANTPRYIGKYWCLGTLAETPVPQDGVASNPPTPTRSGFACDGQILDNSSQTDIFKADVKFTAVQARHNDSFRCNLTASPTPTPPVVTPSIVPTPTPLACQQSDIMLVLDRSGSINSTELSQLKAAAKNFVDALGLSTLGVHAGITSFATTATLDHHLSENSVTLKAAIDALASGGFTNLKDGIDLARIELSNPGDGHDRPDHISPDIMIIITDGHPNRPFPIPSAPAVAAAAANLARVEGIEIYVVGVGSDVNATYLQTQIADSPAHYFSVANYSGLQSILENLDFCE